MPENMYIPDNFSDKEKDIARWGYEALMYLKEDWCREHKEEYGHGVNVRMDIPYKITLEDISEKIVESVDNDTRKGYFEDLVDRINNVAYLDVHKVINAMTMYDLYGTYPLPSRT